MYNQNNFLNSKDFILVMNLLNLALHFSGHETFPIRQLWLHKAYNYALRHSKEEKGASFGGDHAMIELGVGKNMVSSIRFWAEATNFLDNKNGGLEPSPLGRLIFGELDPTSENPNTPWLVHWQLASQSHRSTVFWFLFNQLNSQYITREDIQEGLVSLAGKSGKKVSHQTIKRDVEVCLRSYVPFMAGRNKTVTEEFIEPLLSSLGIINVVNKDIIEIPRTTRPTLSNGLFAYALMDFWQTRLDNSSSIDYFQIAHAIGSPGKVFRLDEISLTRRLEDLEALTQGELIWTEQSGIKTVIRRKSALNQPEKFKAQMLRLAYQL